MCVYDFKLPRCIGQPTRILILEKCQLSYSSSHRLSLVLCIVVGHCKISPILYQHVYWYCHCYSLHFHVAIPRRNCFTASFLVVWLLQSLFSLLQWSLKYRCRSSDKYESLVVGLLIINDFCVMPSRKLSLKQIETIIDCFVHKPDVFEKIKLFRKHPLIESRTHFLRCHKVCIPSVSWRWLWQEVELQDLWKRNTPWNHFKNLPLKDSLNFYTYFRKVI